MKIILASGSPRRRELIKKITDTYEVCVADVNEDEIEAQIEQSFNGCNKAELAEKIVRALSKEKALAAFEKLGCPADTLFIGADTIVALENEILVKPKDRDDAVRMLRAESMEPQRVMTGVTLVYRGEDDSASCGGCGKCCESKPQSLEISTRIRTFTELSLVYFKPLDEAQEARIQAYCDTDEPYDKSGSYAIQLGGASLVDRFEGDVENIVGFPTERIKAEIAAFVGDITK